VLVVAAAVAAIAAAVRSTWSPCGLSMLSSITPISERAKGHRYGVTCTWFVAGAVLGGLTLGLGAALLAAAVASLDPAAELLLVAAGIALITAAESDAPQGFTLPFHRRQVNEDWLDQYRPWLYASGFGWQIGVGVGTYVMTAGVYALVALGALTGQPASALALGGLFGLVRGLAVFASRGAGTPEQLLALHARFERATEPVRDAVAITYFVAGGALLVAAVGPIALLWLAGGVLGAHLQQRRRRLLRHAAA
jgi:hypothetical protein